MFTKTLLVSLVLSGFVFSQTAEKCFADISSQFEQAKAYVENKHYEQAEVIYQTIAQDYPDTNDALAAQTGLTVLYITWGKEPEAQAGLAGLVADFSGHQGIANSLNEIANIFRYVQRYQKAGELYQYVIDGQPPVKDAIWSQACLIGLDVVLGDDSTTQSALEQLLSEFSDVEDMPAIFDGLAEDCVKVKKYNEARQLYQYILDNRPDSKRAIWAQSGLGVLNAALGNDAGADAVIERLLVDFWGHPDLPEAITRIEEAYYMRILAAETWARENYLNPVIIWEKVISKFPDFFYNEPDLYYFIACCYYQLGKYDNAIGYYRKVAANWPNYYQAWGTLSLIETSYKGLKEADAIGQTEASAQIEQIYNEIIENSPKSTSAKYACLKLGRKYFDSQRWADAAFYFALLWQSFPDDTCLSQVVYDLGRAYEQMGETAIAMETYEEFLKDHPTDVRIKARLEELKAANK